MVTSATQSKAERVLTLFAKCRPGIATPRLDQELAKVEPRDFLRFEQELRDYWAAPWYNFQPEKVSPEHSPSALCLLSAHPNGRVREAALRAMQPGPQLSRWIFIRANDWTEPVARLACQLAIAQLQRGWARHWLPYLPLLFEGGRRRSFEPLQEAVRQQAKECPLIFAHFVARTEESVKARRIALQLVTEVAPEMAREVASKSEDVVMRSQCLRALQSPDDLRPFLKDPVPLLRSRALSSLAQQGHLTLEELREGLLDGARGVREAALYFCKKSPGIEFARQVYRQAPLCRGRLLGAPAVLEADEVEQLCLDHLQEAKPLHAKAALMALADCSKRADDLLWEALAHKSANLRRTAGKLLRERRSIYLQGEFLWPRMAQSSPEVACEIIQLASKSHCPYTRVEALCRQATGLSEGELESGLLTARQMMGPYRPDTQRMDEVSRLLSDLDPPWRQTVVPLVEKVFR